MADDTGTPLRIDFRVPAAPLPFVPAAIAQSQQAANPGAAAAPAGTAILRGRIVSTDGRAIAHAQVRLMSTPRVTPGSSTCD